MFIEFKRVGYSKPTSISVDHIVAVQPNDADTSILYTVPTASTSNGRYKIQEPYASVMARIRSVG